MTQNELIAAMNAVTATFPDDKLPADIFQQERSVYNDRCRELCAQLRESQEQDVFEALFSYACATHRPILHRILPHSCCSLSDRTARCRAGKRYGLL